MANTQSQFVIERYDGFGGNFVDSQYLGAAYDSGKPHEFDGMLMKIYSSEDRFFTGKPMLGMTGAKSYGTKEIDTEVYRWYLQGAEEKSARVLENLETTTTPGFMNTKFRIKLDLDYYAAPDVLFGEDNDYPLRIVDGPIQDGSGYIYTVRLQGDDPTAFFPTNLLEPGQEFCKVWTSVASEGNQEFGTQQVPSSFKLESQVSAFAQKISVTDKAMRDQGRLGIKVGYTDYKTGKRKMIDQFLPMYESKMHEELYMSMEAQMIYGKKETTLTNPTKYWTKTGPGLREQLRDSWIEYYNGALTTNRIKDYLLNIFFARENEQDRRVVAMTGTLGSLMFHDMLAAEASSFLTVDSHYIGKVASPGETPHLAYGAQFTRYRGPEGIVVDLVKNPTYDSRKYCKRMHPLYPDKPIDSARMTFLDFGSSEGEGNISMLKVKDTYRYGYTVGTVGPMGPVQGGQVGALKAGYDMFTEGTAGLWIKDVSRCGELIFDYEY
tara:strand:- start:419 stop:1897 length:1479 start_codon:yes stop_codon:yes gene_type:complete